MNTSRNDKELLWLTPTHAQWLHKKTIHTHILIWYLHTRAILASHRKRHLEWLLQTCFMRIKKSTKKYIPVV